MYRLQGWRNVLQCPEASSLDRAPGGKVVSKANNKSAEGEKGLVVDGGESRKE